MKSDGKVVISTALDNSGVEKGTKEIVGELGGLENVLNKTSKTISGAMSKPIADAHAQIRKELNSTQKQIEQYQKQIQKAESEKMPLLEQAERLGVELDEAKGKLAQLQAQQKATEDILAAAGNRELSTAELNSYLDAYAQKPGLDVAVARQQEQVNGLQKQWDNVNNKIDTYNFKIDQANNEITAQKANADDLSARLASGGRGMADAMDKAKKSTKSAEKEVKKAEKETKRLSKSASSASGHFNSISKSVKGFGSRLKSIVSGALVFNLISSGLRELTSYMGKTLKTNDAFSSALAKLKGALLTAFQPIYDAVAPALTFLVECLTDVTVAVAQLFSCLSGKSAEEYAASAKSLYEEANALDQVASSAKNAKKSLAGFDELTVLQGKSDSANSESSLTTPDFSVVKDSSAMAQSWTNIAEKSKEFYYEVLGKLSVRNLENFTASLDNLSSGWNNLVRTFSSSDFSLSDFVAEAIDVSALFNAGQNKMLGGLLDLLAESRKNYAETGATGLAALIESAFTDEDVWDALGETFSGWGMAMAAYMPEGGIFGITKEEWENLFLPITEEYTNLFRDLSAAAAEALAEYRSLEKKLSTKLKKLDWSNTIITEEEVAEVKSLTNDVFNTIIKNNKEARQAAEDSIASLLAEGLISEADAQAAILELEETYNAQEQLVQDNQNQILSILEKAKSEKRALTAEENAQITALMNECNDKTIAVISQGASDSSEIYKMIEENRGKMSKQMLSQTIQYANDEYAATVKAAEDTYAASIANADMLYNDLGVIDAEEYERIKKEAEEKKNIQIEEAAKAKNALIKEAQDAAGGVADAVDPETGEILSNWEALWNSMFGKANKTWTDITAKCKGFVNRIIGLNDDMASGVEKGIIPMEISFTGLWGSVKNQAVLAWNGIQSAFSAIGNWIDTNVIKPVTGFFTGLWDGFTEKARAAWEGVKSVFGKVASFFSDTFKKAWSGIVNIFSTAGEIFTDIKDGILTAFKKIVNGIISGLNKAIKVPFDGINSALRKIRDIKILGLTPFSGLKTISVPQIPYLAQGAVLPPNKPFMAVVGDQKHGTNIEAPLSTIQEAVALVMEDQVATMMTGFEALLEENRRLRQIVENIEVGDTTIGAAAQRYNSKMRIARGGL